MGESLYAERDLGMRDWIFGNARRDGWAAHVSLRAVFGFGTNGLVSLRDKDEKRCARIDSEAFYPHDRYPNVPEEHKRA